MRGEVKETLRSKQIGGVIIAPRRTAHHTVFHLSIIPINAPLPYVASHVVQPKLVCRKASRWTSPWIAVVIAFNDWVSGGPVLVQRLSPSVISGSSRRRPAFVPFLWDGPRIQLDLATLLFRVVPYLILQPNSGAPFFVLRQPVFPVLRQISRTSFAFRQPLTEFLRVIPTNPHHRMVRPLAKPKRSSGQ